MAHRPVTSVEPVPVAVVGATGRGIVPAALLRDHTMTLTRLEDVARERVAGIRTPT